MSKNYFVNIIKKVEGIWENFLITCFQKRVWSLWKIWSLQLAIIENLAPKILWTRSRQNRSTLSGFIKKNAKSLCAHLVLSFCVCLLYLVRVYPYSGEQNIKNARYDSVAHVKILNLRTTIQVNNFLTVN